MATVRVRTGALLCALTLLAPGVTVHAGPGTVPRLPWMFDGAVLSSARLGNTLYVGGAFTAVGPSSSAMPPVYALSDSDGAVIGPAFPPMDGEVAAIEPDGSGGHYLGGTFTVAAGLPQPYLVHVLADGTVDAVFRPALTGPVTALARIGTALYVLGAFDSPGPFPTRAGVVSTTDGSRGAWRPVLPGSLESVGGMLAADDRIVFWGTDHIPMITTGVVSAYDASTAAALWTTAVSGGVQRFGSVISVLRAADHLVVASSDGLRRLALATGAIDQGWDPQVTPTALALAGSTLYLGGGFSSVAGQPRQNLAAIDVTTGALLPWSPRAPVPITTLAIASTGAVYAGGAFSVFGGQARTRLARLDSSGALTGWVAAVPPGDSFTIREGPGGSLLVSSTLTMAVRATRRGLAAFDLSSGALLPWAPSAGTVRFLAAAGDRVWASIDGATFVFDAATGIDVDFAGYTTSFFADDRWVYRLSWTPLTEDFAIDRADLITGTPDTSWRPLVFVPDAVTAGDQFLYFASQQHGLAAVDRRTARVLWTNTTATARFIAVSGDTLFASSEGFGRGLEAFDARNGRSIRSGIWNPLTLEGMTIADGRLVALTWQGPALVGLDGQPLAWDLGLDRTLGGYGGHVSATGDLLVLGGRFGRRLPEAQQGLVVLSLDGTTALAGLRARPSGPATTFIWTPPSVVPSGGYVIEAGTIGGPAQVTIPVGDTSHFVTEVPPGDFFVRVRTVGAVAGTEQASNEIRVRGGCANAPAPPADLTSQLAASMVTLSWSAPDAIVSHYIVEAGSAPGLANLAALPVPGRQTTLTASAPPGTYHARVRAVNGCGTSLPSAPIYFTIGSASTLPGAATGLRYQFTGYRELISWTPPPGEVTGYILEAGTDIGLANLLVTAVGPYPVFVIPPFTTPRGTYIVRVRAVNPAGVGPPSEDFVLRLQ